MIQQQENPFVLKQRDWGGRDSGTWHPRAGAGPGCQHAVVAHYFWGKAGEKESMGRDEEWLGWHGSKSLWKFLLVRHPSEKSKVVSRGQGWNWDYWAQRKSLKQSWKVVIFQGVQNSIDPISHACHLFINRWRSEFPPLKPLSRTRS
jgi:hypothetical protein